MTGAAVQLHSALPYSFRHQERVTEGLPLKIHGYDVIDRLGIGAGSTLYVVSEPKTHQLYALKHVVRREDKEQRFIDQLENEFEVSKHFSHPVLRKAVDYKHNGTWLKKPSEAALVCELVDGWPLEKQPRKPFPETVAIFIQVARGLEAMHFAGYVHCDMKPGNILTGPDNLVKVIDFGQTTRLMTAKERVQGTPDFIAPEQVERKPVTARTDIFNFGATLFWALSGHKIPTLYKVKKEQRTFIRDEDIPPPHLINPQIPADLSVLVKTMILISPANRPRSMGEIVKGLEAALRAMAGS